MFQTTNQYMSQCAYQESWLMYFWSLRPTKPGWRHVLLNQIVSSHLAYGHGMAIKTYQNMHFFRGIQQPGPPISNTLWKITIFNGKTHYKWPFSIAMLNYQRVCFLKSSEVILPCSIPMMSSHWGWQQSVSEPQGEPCKAAVAAIVPVHCPAHGEASWSTAPIKPRFLDPSHWGPVSPQNKGGWFWRYPHCGPQIRREKVSV